jgi:predicted HAD superfamily phosphohydrolase
MTAAAAHIIEDFEALPEQEKREVLAKLLQIASHLDYGPISEEELLTSADELFVAFDREEQPSKRL